MSPTLCDNSYPDKFAVDVQLWHLCALDVVVHSNQNSPSISVSIFPVDTVLRWEEHVPHGARDVSASDISQAETDKLILIMLTALKTSNTRGGGVGGGGGGGGGRGGGG